MERTLVLKRSLKYIKVISFDLDDTLWENHTVIKRASAASLVELNRHHNRATINFAQLNPIKPRLIAGNAELQWDLTALRLACYKALLIDRGLPDHIAAPAAQQAVAVFSKLRSEVSPFEGAIDSLAALAKKWPLVAITNGNCNLFSLPFGHYFSFYISPLQAKATKPNKQIYEYAANHIGVATSDILHIGDCPHNDIDAAKAAGCQTIWYNRNNRHFGGNSQPDYEINQLAELKNLTTGVGVKF